MKSTKEEKVRLKRAEAEIEFAQSLTALNYALAGEADARTLNIQLHTDQDREAFNNTKDKVPSDR